MLRLRTSLFTIYLCFVFTFINCAKESNDSNYRINVNDKEVDDTLVLVHTLLRHGERTTDPTTIYPKDPYINETYYPYGRGQLTIRGKKTEYEIGKSLRKRYDKFLGRNYFPDILDARSSNYNRTKMSLQLVLAGLFPPIGDQIFEPGLFWQPIPYNYEPKDRDKELLGFTCPNYKKHYAELIQSPKMQKEIYEYKELFDYLSEKTGWNVTNFGDLFYIYFGLRSEREWGFELPSWSNIVYPRPLEDLMIKEYKYKTANTELKKLATGYFLRKIIEDTRNKIDGTLDPQERKIFLYSGMELNIGTFLTTLDIFEPQIPPYGCYILIEVHKKQGVYGIEIYFENYKGTEPKLLKLPGCEEFCPFDQFTSLVQEIIPENDDLCG